MIRRQETAVADHDFELLSEARSAVELAQLLGDPIFRGSGVPRGDGKLVLVLPGLFGNDLYLQPLRSWLGRIGYRPVRSSLALNAGCGDRLTRQVVNELAKHRQSQPGRLAIIGHSRGGILARAIAARLGDEVSHLCFLGSPAAALSNMRAGAADPSKYARPLIVDAGLRARKLLDPDCNFPDCGCEFAADLGKTLPSATKVLSVYSKTDPVVAWQASHLTGAQNVEVEGTHSGLAHNRAVYRALAEFLGS
jgi:pimeloyl-ACP methyl ester carboxylesterase